MWKDYSKSYLKRNRASSVSILAAAFIAALFLSLLCSVAYNLWAYEVEKISTEEGDWQGRILGERAEEDLLLMQNFANVERVVVKENSVDLYFHNPRTIYRDLPLLAAQLGCGEEDILYHELLLSRYLIHDPQDENPPMLLSLYLGILIVAMVSLILIIRNAFELSMNARIRQFGILSSIGATPKQIRICLLQEAAALSVLPILLGILAGIALSYGMLEAVNFFASDVAGRRDAVFCYHPFLFLITALSAVLTAFFSAWIPARKLSKITPLAAIRNAGGLQLKKRKHSRVLSLLFGMKGELVGNALKAQKKSFRISALSLLLSFLGFSVMLAFTTLSEISTRYTYFERYQDAWDVMVTVKDRAISDFRLTEDLADVAGVRDATVYQKADARAVLPWDWQSEELLALGGFSAVAGNLDEENYISVETPIVVLDDAGFLAYCAQNGISPSLDGTVVLNKIWDSVNSNFRNKEYIPFLKEGQKTIAIFPKGTDEQQDAAVEIPILAYAQTEPVLREEYEAYALVQIMPLTLWENTFGETECAKPDCYIRIFSDGNANLSDLSRLENEIVSLVGQEYEMESENRVQERISNNRMIDGMQVIFGALCVLLAIIGIANVFSNTLGFLRQRKREFAQYRSIGLTPRDMRDMFCIEAFVVAGRPLFLTLLLTVPFVQFMVRASYLDAMVFWAEAPILPIGVFAAAIVCFVALAYYIGGRRILRCDLNETLRDDVLG